MKEHLSILWAKLTSIYGAIFTSIHGVEDSGVWFAALKDLTPTALERGVDSLLALKKGDTFCKYPPNCLDFRALCLGFYSELRLPTPSQAHREILNRAYVSNSNWSHVVVKFTAQRLGDDFLNIENEGESFAVFKIVYEQACHLVRQGYQISEIKEQVLLPKPQSTEIAKKNLRAIHQLLGTAV